MKACVWVLVASCGWMVPGCGARVVTWTPPDDPPPGAAVDAGLPPPVDAGTTAPAPAPAPVLHSRFPQLPDQGGPRMHHPQLVAITWADDPRAAADEALTRYLAGSPWLALVGQDYGVGAGTMLGAVRRPGAAPAVMTDAEIEAGLVADVREGVLPSAADGRFDETLYIVFVPGGTRVTQGNDTFRATSCMDFLGYHGAAGVAPSRFAYAVAVACDDPITLDAMGHPVGGVGTDSLLQVTTSHELIEAATDPDPLVAPAYEFRPSDGQPWTEFGPEIGDLCAERYVPMDGYLLQRAWSNRAAAEGRFPCAPLSPDGT